MSGLVLYAHPFSSYCQKVLIPLHELGFQFEYRQLGGDAGVQQRFGELWPLRKMPVLVDGARVLREATIIVEHLHIKAGPRSTLLPSDPAAALDVRFLDRVFDNYVMTPMQRIVVNAMRPEAERDPLAGQEARASLENAYQWLEGHLASVKGDWVAGAAFTLADCAAMPALFYADWVHRIDERWPCLAAYRARLLARPHVQVIVEAARPYRSFFPLGAPDRD